MPYPFEYRLSDDAIHRVVDFMIGDLPTELATPAKQEHLLEMRKRARMAIREAESDLNWHDARREWLHWMDSLFAHRLEEMEKHLCDVQTKHSNQLEQVLRVQLTKVQGVIRDSVVPCRFQSEGAAGGYMQLMTALSPSPAGPLEADAPKFLSTLKKIASTGNVLVLVDPYALAATDDSGRLRSYAREVHDLVEGLSLDKFVVYCRNDAIHTPCLDALLEKLGKKLEVRCGDLHDRYLLVGREGNSKSPFVELTEHWHGLTAWMGVAFGASLNGVSKRPTYILKFETQDISVVSKYLKGVAPSPRTL